MPELKELIKERGIKKFTKKTYRPWDLSGDSTSLKINAHSESTPQESLINKNEILDITENDHLKSLDESNNSDITLDNKKISNVYHSGIETDTHQESIKYPKDITIGNNEVTKSNHLDNILDTIKISKTEDINAHVNLNNSDKNAQYNETIEVINNKKNETLEPILEQEIIRLSGKQKLIFDMVIEICAARDSLETGPVQTASLAIVAQTTLGTTKTTLKRLIDKKLLIRHAGKNAKGGYINLGITIEILKLVENIKKNNKSNIFASDIILAHRYQKDISQDVYNSSINNNITTNNINKRNESIPSEWDNVNYDPLAHIGFTKTQIKQIIDKNEPTVVQESIYHFAFGLEHNPKFKKYEEPLNVLMGVLRKGQGWIESEYRSASEIAQLKFLESKKAEIARRKSLEEEAYKLAFNEWEETLGEQERLKLTEKKNGDLTPPIAKLSKYFKENIWPNKKREYIL
ncbi:MAG TPA: hypothetical protein PK657_10160 [Legionella sp.]|nr:hypothetical protein [Legionella sp.]